MVIVEGGRDLSTFVGSFCFCGSSGSPVALGFFFCLSEVLRPAWAKIWSVARKLLAMKAVASAAAMANASFSFQLGFVLDCLFIFSPRWILPPKPIGLDREENRLDRA